MDRKKAAEISDFIDSYLIMNDMQEIAASEASKILDRAGILKEGARPGRHLRVYLSAGILPNSFKKGRLWYFGRLPKIGRSEMRNHHRVIFPE